MSGTTRAVVKSTDDTADTEDAPRTDVADGTDVADVAGAEEARPRGLWRRLHAWSGLVLASAMLVQLWWLSKVSLAPTALAEVCSHYHDGAATWLLLPLLAFAYHGVYGLWLVLGRGRTSTAARPDRMRSLQRISGPLAGVWLIWPLITLAWPLHRGALQPEDAAELIRAALSTTTYGVPLLAFGFLMGLAAAVFHLVNGLWRALGARRPASGRSLFGVLVGVLGMALFAVAAHGVIYLANGWRVYPPLFEAPPDTAPGRAPM